MTRWLARLWASKSERAHRRPRAVRLRLELLENRLAPAVITVTTTADETVTNDAPSVSLREAIISINNAADTGADVTANRVGAYGVNDTINFNIAGAGVQTLSLGSSLPTIVKPVTVNGYTQAGASANTQANADNAVILVELNGTGAGTAVNGLTLGAGSGGSTIEGLAINRFQADASLNGGVGILVQSNGNTIVGDFVGVNPAGTAQMPNGGDGIRVLDASNNKIGSTNPADRNIVSGNTLDGIHVEGALTTPATGNLIQGNFVGVGANGVSRVGTRTAPIPNAGALGTDSGNFLFGIEISGGNNNTVGGVTAGARNVVGFNGEGVEIDNGGQQNIVQGNFSGVGADGVTPVKNLLHGIVLRSSNTFNAPLGPAQPNEPGVSFNTIGGTAAGAGNLVEFNGAAGVAVFGNPVSASGQANIGNAIEGNSIFENGRNNPTVLLGIDLTNQFKFPQDDGVTANDSKGHGAANDPNNFQDFPVLISATPAGGGTNVTGTLKGAPNSTFRIEFFASNADPAGGIPEGQQFLGSTSVTTDGNGNASFNISVNVAVATGRIITATATDSIGNTSEFSAGLTVPTLPPSPPPTPPPPTPPPTALDADHHFIQALYNDFLGRNGAPTELNAWVNVLPALGQAGVANAILHSPEALTHAVDGFYVRFLGRQAVSGEEAGWVGLLENGATEEQVTAGILSSPEFAAHANALIGGATADANFVQALYKLLLNRTGSSSEVNAWLGALPNGRAFVALGFLASPEYRTDVVTQFYGTLVDRSTAPAAREVAGWVNSGLDILAIDVGFASSPEYFLNG
jgi:hypothetical protein